MKNSLITIIMTLIFSTNVKANSAVLGLGLDSCAKVIENVEKNDELGKVLRLLIRHTSWVFLVVLMLSMKMIRGWINLKDCIKRQYQIAKLHQTLAS